MQYVKEIEKIIKKIISIMLENKLQGIKSKELQISE